MTAFETFYELVQLMAVDNGCTFYPTAMHCARAEASITQLLDRGWQPALSTKLLNYGEGPYTNDMLLLASGEESDVQALVAHWGENMRILTTVMEEVFNAG